MKRKLALLAAALLCAALPALAVYSVSHRGDWARTWPAGLEPLRKQARTYVGPDVGSQHHQISFTSREQFEAAWPQILSVKTKGAPIILMRSPEARFDKIEAGVIVNNPPIGVDKHLFPEGPIAGHTEPRLRWAYTNYIELIVDGNVVDLNRLPLPADTPIVDERFKDTK